MSLKKCFTSAFISSLVATCTYTSAEDKISNKLIGWVALDHSERWSGPTSGNFIKTGNGVTPPFYLKQPIPGWSGLLKNDDGSYTAMPDNGYGAKGNSADFVLGFYNITPYFKRSSDHTNNPGNVVNNRFVAFNDRNGLLKNGVGIDIMITADFTTYRNGAGHGYNSNIPVDQRIIDGRLLTGYDFDVESIARANDGSYWVGEEFGPFLLHFNAQGTLIKEPIPHPTLISPQHPQALAIPGTNTLGGSRGFESMSFNKQKNRLYAVTESAPIKRSLQAVAGDERVVEIFEFNPASAAYTGVSFKYRKDGAAKNNAIVLGDMTNVGKDRFVIIERDNESAAKAKVKKLYIVNLNSVDKEGVLKKNLLLDLLDIDDPMDIGGDLANVKEGKFNLPFTSVECVLQIDQNTIGVAVDTNFPASARKSGIPASTEFIQVKFPEPIESYAPRA